MTGIRNNAYETAADEALPPSARRLGKTSFDDIYDRPDPRDYFRRLRPLEYRTPHHAQQIFRRLIEARTPISGLDRPATVVDVCCSYGVNAALLCHDVTLDDLYDRYTSPRTAGLTRDQLVAQDRAFYAERRLPLAAQVIGLDAARHAVAYARTAGLLDEGFGEDLELKDPSADLVRTLHPVHLITVTGGVGYITSRTFEQILPHIDGPVWVAAFVLRTVGYGPIADTLARFGLVTQKAPRTFPQRRFSDAHEERHAMEAVMARGLSPEGKESTGYYHVELYLSRPKEHAAAFPVEDLLIGG
jgi:hypothetical protein